MGSVPLAEVPFDLVEAKLAVPSTRPGTVAKTDVIQALCASRSPLVTVIAPAGYGKTTFLARWAEADPRPFAWVALDSRDDDPVVLLRYIAGAMHRLEPLPPEVFDALSGPGGAGWTKRVVQLANALAAREQPFVLAFDDLHSIANSSCLDVLGELLESVPAGSQIAVASREEPALPLGRLRAHGRLHELGSADLRLDEREAELLLRAAGTVLGEDEVNELTERTEGWAAGLYLAALSMQAGSPSPASTGIFTGDDRFVTDYFRVELMSRLPDTESRFLKQTSILERMCGGLCDSVIGSTGSAGVLEQLERTNRFVVPLDRRAEWYRYHHLFAELLRNELTRSEPDATAELNRRAMAWCIAHDFHEAALIYGHAAGETDVVAGLVDELALPTHYDGRMETLDGWLRWFSEDDLRRYPALAVEGGWLRALTGRSAEAERWLALAEGATSTIALSDGSATIDPWVALLRAGMMPDGPERAVADGELAVAELAAGSAWRPAALAVLGTARVILGDYESAIADLTAAVEGGSGATQPLTVARGQLALLAIGRGAWNEARQHASAGQAVVDEAGLSDYSTSALVHVATARVALHEGRQPDARAALTSAHRLRPMLDHGIPWLTLQVGLELARAHLALAEPGPARMVLSEAEHVLEVRPHMGILVDDARELHDRAAASSGSDGAWAMTLTGAELRLLPYLATHLTFSETASRLFISRNTVKSEAVSIYRKLGVSSRSEAIQRAVELGLLESSVYPPRANFTPEG
jgi:LuxR family transcriptional regulator, maltose regulon positive regulatory protein